MAARDQPLPLSEVHRLIAAFAPTLHFHPREVFFPSSIDWYLSRADLVSQTGGIIAHHPAATDLPTDAADPANPEALWLALDPAGVDPAADPDTLPPADWRRGALETAKAYVRAVHDPAAGHTDLQFWLFYPFDGPGTARIRLFEAGALRGSDDLSLWPIGRHQADWEMSAIRIDHTTLEPSAVFLSQHYGGDSYVGEAALAGLERDADGRLRFYAAQNSHATYAHDEVRPIYYKRASLLIASAEYALIDETAAGGQSIDLSQPQRYEIVSTAWNDPAVAEPLWLRFAYRWGRFDADGGELRPKLLRRVTGVIDHRAPAFVALASIVTAGLFALAEALLPVVLGGQRGRKLLGAYRDTSGPVGPSQQQAKWSGNYGFPGPPPPTEWRGDGKPWQRGLANAADAIARPLVAVIGAAARLIAGLFGSGR